MKPYNQHEYNRLCAEFLGWESLSPKTKYCYWKYPEEKSFTFKLGSPVHSNNLIFHSDWNWIMEVVEKIEITNSPSLNEWMRSYVTIWSNREGCTIEVKTEEEDFYTSIPVKTTKQEAVVQAIWQFLNWYNEQK